LKKAKGGSIPHTRAAIEQASTKQNPREYIGRIMNGAGQPRTISTPIRPREPHLSIVPFSKNELASGLFSLKNLPQRGSVSEIATGTGWWELDQIFKLYPGQFVVVTGDAGQRQVDVHAQHAGQHEPHHEDFRSMLFVPENEGHLLEKMQRIWGDRPGFDGSARSNAGTIGGR
jgi:hypothetical protein